MELKWRCIYGAGRAGNSATYQFGAAFEKALVECQLLALSAIAHAGKLPLEIQGGQGNAASLLAK
jgi:hypothetical protein